MMELRQLKYFLKTAELLSFSEAAKALSITQSTLSQQIKHLENELGVELFHRNSHEVQLTEAGEHMVPNARATLVSADTCVESINELKAIMTGTLNIGVTYTFSPLLTDALFDFTRHYPHVHMNIIYKSMNELMEMLQQRELDFVLAFKPSERYANIDSHVLFSTHLTAVVRTGHPLTKLSSVSLSELDYYDMALPATGLQARNAFDKILADSDHHPHVLIELNDVEILLKLVQLSNYVSVLAETTIHGLEGIKGVPLKNCEDLMEGCIHVRKNTYVKNSAREFYRILSDSEAIKRYSVLADLM
ncbi:LysR substrate binding domain protein [Prevotella sp. DNF00663]|nr:LysR substrate binding domain protein [Prevotella sp. DNF00663]